MTDRLCEADGCSSKHNVTQHYEVQKKFDILRLGDNFRPVTWMPVLGPQVPL